MTKVLIKLLDALAGSGKTHASVLYAIECARSDQKIVIVQPSMQLIDEWFETTQEWAPDVKVIRIDTSTSPGGVTAALIQHLKATPEDVGEVLFITHAAFLSVPYWHKRDRWTVIFDEVPPAVVDLGITVPDEHGWLTQHIQRVPFNVTHSELLANGDTRRLEQLASNVRNDDVWKVFSNIARKLLDDRWRVFVHNANYTSVVEGHGDERRKHKLLVYGLLQPSAFAGFGEVILAGAMIKQSLIYMLWQDQVTYRLHRMQKQLRYDKHSNGHLINVEYVFDRTWSKTFRNRSIEGRRAGEIAVDLVRKTLQGQEFLYVANNDADQKLLAPLAHGTRISSACQGLNEYTRFDNLAYLSALNPQPAYFEFLDTLDINKDELRRALYMQAIYQAVMRTSVRSPESTTRKRIIVMDRDAADFLALNFPGCAVRQMDGAPRVALCSTGRPKVWRDDSARGHARQMKQRALREIADLNRNGQRPTVTLIASVFSTELIDHEITSNQAFMHELRQAVTHVAKSKDDNILISPAQFNPRRSSDTKRGLANVERINGIWLDNDGGHFSPDDFRRVFPDLWFAAFNTYSGQGRYRLFIPTCQAMTIDVDRKIKEMMLRLIEQDMRLREIHEIPEHLLAFRVPPHGFDLSKLTPTSFFYLPCRRPDDEGWFFTEYHGQELDPAFWISNPPISGAFEVPTSKPVGPKLEVRAVAEDGQIDGARIAAAEARYLAVPTGHGLRNAAFFRLAMGLRRAGCSDFDIRCRLEQLAQDQDRRNQIPSVMRSLGKLTSAI